MHRDRRRVGASAALSRMRSRRLLRRFSQPSRHQALSQNQAPHYAQLRAGRGLGLVLCRSARVRAGAASRALGYRPAGWMSAMMFPSVSLNQAALLPPVETMLSFVLSPGMSYSSNRTPRAFSSATSRSRSVTSQNAWLALDVPALRAG